MPKVAVIHEWLVNYAGSEKVLEQILLCYPDADLFCQVDFLAENERGFVLNKKTTTSFIQHLPFAKTKYRSYFPLMPFAVGRFDVSAYDIIISNSHSVAKGVRKRAGQLHICYCHTPMRYAWDLQTQYLKEAGLDSGLKGALVKNILERIRKWDFDTARSVHHFAANSIYIKDRIKRVYGKDARVIYPPVDVAGFTPGGKKDNFFLTASRMVPYKKMDLIVEAFSELGLSLVVIGDGPDLEKIKSKAAKNIELIGYQEKSVLAEYMRKARAFVFAAEEDFGIVPVEAQACGTPVIAFGRGGATETIISPENEGALSTEKEGRSPTGIFFHEQTASALMEAVKRFLTIEGRFDPAEIRRNAERFSTERFRREFLDFMSSCT